MHFIDELRSRRGLLALATLGLVTVAVPAVAKPKHSDCDAEAAEETNCVYDPPPTHQGGDRKDHGRKATRARVAAPAPAATPAARKAQAAEEATTIVRSPATARPAGR